MTAPDDSSTGIARPGFCPPEVTKVLFLDIDGVIRPFRRDVNYSVNSDPRELRKVHKELFKIHKIDYSGYDEYDVRIVYFSWDRKAASLVKDIATKTGAGIVLSSSWRYPDSLDPVYDYFRIHDLHKHYIDNTKIYTSEEMAALRKKYGAITTNARTIEIREYLEQHPQIANYVAIDDMELNPGLENHFVKAAHGKLTKKEAAEALKILNS